MQNVQIIAILLLIATALALLNRANNRRLKRKLTLSAADVGLTELPPSEMDNSKLTEAHRLNLMKEYGLDVLHVLFNGKEAIYFMRRPFDRHVVISKDCFGSVTSLTAYHEGGISYLRVETEPDIDSLDPVTKLAWRLRLNIDPPVAVELSRHTVSIRCTNTDIRLTSSDLGDVERLLIDHLHESNEETP